MATAGRERGGAEHEPREEGEPADAKRTRDGEPLVTKAQEGRGRSIGTALPQDVVHDPEPSIPWTRERGFNTIRWRARSEPAA